MEKRLPLILSAVAVVISLLGTTPIGSAASRLLAKTVPFATFATNAGAVSGIKAARTPTPGDLVPLGTNGKFAASVIPSRATGSTNGTSGVIRIGASVNVAPGADVTANAECNADEHATGGGFFTQPGMPVLASRPIPETVNGAVATGWSVNVTNTTTIALPTAAYAICST